MSAEETRSKTAEAGANNPVRSMTYLEFGLLVLTVASTLFYVTLQSIVLVYRYLYPIFILTMLKFIWGEYTNELRGGTRTCPNSVSMKGKTVVLTGGTTGTGRASAIEMASRGARIIMGCRNLKRAGEVVEIVKRRSCNNDIVIHYLDLSSFKSVREFADKIRKEENGIDVLINNASVSDFESHDTHRIPHTTVDGLSHSFQVNYWSHFLLSNLLLTLLVKRPSSRIVNVTARLHTKPTNLNFTAGNGKLRYPRLTGYPLGKFGKRAIYQGTRFTIGRIRGQSLTLSIRSNVLERA
ncbi:hypothetical protein BSL78_25327 [Apostichopus japonicus]|uniref:Uncharacterized protein n=1 Tax=Stichopus japonicus TaxID=307972 RepID=A0A2G8JQ02_STIJA|nr:hypothetical protein BSL78_25327 [Apostichopus japonicus]